MPRLQPEATVSANKFPLACRSSTDEITCLARCQIAVLYLVVSRQQIYSLHAFRRVGFLHGIRNPVCNRSNFPSNPGSPRECPGREPKDVREPTVAGVSSPGRQHRLERGQKRKLQMASTNQKTSATETVTNIEKDWWPRAGKAAFLNKRAHDTK